MDIATITVQQIQPDFGGTYIQHFQHCFLYCFHNTVNHDGIKSKKTKDQSVTKAAEINLIAQHDELLITQILNPESPSSTISTPPSTANSNTGIQKQNHPHFGDKQPKQHKPSKCINVECKQRKKELEEELKYTKEQLMSALDELSKLKHFFLFHSYMQLISLYMNIVEPNDEH